MTERVNKCFNCGNEGHFARECTESNNCFIQPESPDRLENLEKIGKEEITEEVPATTAEKAVISQEIVKHLLKTEPDALIANKTATEEEVVVGI